MPSTARSPPGAWRASTSGGCLAAPASHVPWPSSAWIARSSDPSSCNKGVEPDGKCITDSGAVVAENTCTSTLQCDDGVWVDRVDDPSSCGGGSTSCSLAGHTYDQNTCTET